MKKLITCSLLLLAPLFLFSQAKKIKAKDLRALEAAAAELNNTAVTMHTDSAESVRFVACKNLIRDFVEALKTPNSYNYDFAEVQGVAIRTAPDNSFRTITWELHVNRDEYRHYGAIQFNNKKLKLQPLLDRSDTWRSNPENKVSGPTDWLGYTIYEILPGGDLNGQPYYFVFGYDRKEAFVRRKVLDVLTFDAYGKVQFGAPVFATYTAEGLLLQERARIILDYSAEANVVLRKDPASGRIYYENLIMMAGSGEGGPVQMPDGSYHALELREDGLWHEAEKVFSHKYESAPIIAPRPAASGDDVMGRTRPRKPDDGGGQRR